jgi:hypothetical protein
MAFHRPSFFLSFERAPHHTTTENPLRAMVRCLPWCLLLVLIRHGEGGARFSILMNKFNSRQTLSLFRVRELEAVAGKLNAVI